MTDIPKGLLRETLHGRMTPERAAGCLDSQTLAAWSEGTLNPRDRQAIEVHASDCARCQALLAAMVTIAPPVSPSRWWRPSSFGWLAPLAAAAAAILVWVNVPRAPVDRPLTSPTTTTVKSEPPATVVAPPPTASALSTSPEPAARRPVETRTEERAKSAAAQRQSPQSPQPETKDAAPIPQAKGGLEPAGVAPVPALPGAETVTTTSKFADTGAPAKVEAVVGARAASGGGGRAGVLGGLANVGSTPPEIVSPDSSVRWRILPAGHVARSIDRGTTWQEQSTGVSVALMAGAAPSRDVCWLAGAAGTIVISSDGVTWQRVAFPEAIQLVSVRASDASNATVTSADGRTFTTTDGGKSWRQP